MLIRFAKAKPKLTVIQHWHLTLIQQWTNVKMPADGHYKKYEKKMFNHSISYIKHKNVDVPSGYHYSNKRTEDLSCSLHLSVCYHTSQKSGPP